MNVGDRVKFPFKGEEREGTVVRLHDKTVWLRSDFPGHPRKLVRRKVHEIGGTARSRSPGGGLKERLRRRIAALTGRGEERKEEKAEGKKAV